MRNANSTPATRLWTLRELAASYQAVLDDPKKTEPIMPNPRSTQKTYRYLNQYLFPNNRTESWHDSEEHAISEAKERFHRPPRIMLAVTVQDTQTHHIIFSDSRSSSAKKIRDEGAEPIIRDL